MNTDPELGDNISALDQLVDMGYLDKDTPAYGVAMEYLHSGEDSMSDKQRHVFKKFITPVLFKQCQMCGEGIEISALPDAYEQGKLLCSYHLYQSNKND